LPIELEREYRKAKVHATRFAVDNGITDYRMLHKLLYRRLRGMFKLPSAYLRLTIKDASEAARSLMKLRKDWPRVGTRG
jgi:hypothetical protein